jgi:hypothetical protein
MPEVYVDAILKGESEVRVRVLLNSGARNAELILPKRVAKRVGLVVKGKVKVFLGREMKGELGFWRSRSKTLKQVRNALEFWRPWFFPTGFGLPAARDSGSGKTWSDPRYEDRKADLLIHLEWS